MKIHAAVRLDNEVYLPNNDEHAALLADRLSDRQKIRLSDSGNISGPGSEVAGHEVVRTKAGELDNTGGVITKSPTKKSAAKKKAEAKAKKDKAAEAAAAKAAEDEEKAKAAEAEVEAGKEPSTETDGEAMDNEGGAPWKGEGEAPE